VNDPAGRVGERGEVDGRVIFDKAV
jgi:hypothetical protein